MKKFEHDCPNCHFLGNYKEHNLYFCKGNEFTVDTVIARFGDDGTEYISGLSFADDNDLLSEAKKRAINLNLLK